MEGGNCKEKTTKGVQNIFREAKERTLKDKKNYHLKQLNVSNGFAADFKEPPDFLFNTLFLFLTLQLHKLFFPFICKINFIFILIFLCFLEPSPPPTPLRKGVSKIINSKLWQNFTLFKM